MTKTLFAISLLLLSFCNVYAQKNSKYPNIVDFSLENKTTAQPASPNDIKVMAINKDELLSLFKQKHKKLYWVVLYSNMCVGKIGAFEYYNEMRAKYPDSLGACLISSNNYYDIEDILPQLYKFKVFDQTYIVSRDAYAKNYWDEGKRIVKLRNDLCKECKKDIQGCPYNIVFDKDFNVIFHGFRGFNEKNAAYPLNLPEDVITYFMEK